MGNRNFVQVQNCIKFRNFQKHSDLGNIANFLVCNSNVEKNVSKYSMETKTLRDG